MAASHVDAINSIQVEFYATKGPDKKVLDAWRLYSSHLNERLWEAKERNRWGEKKFELLIDLVYLIGQSLGYENIDKAALRDNTYLPQGYVDVEAEWHKIRKAWLELLDGLRPLAMTMVGPVQVEEPIKIPHEAVLLQPAQTALPLPPPALPTNEQ